MCRPVIIGVLENANGVTVYLVGTRRSHVIPWTDNGRKRWARLQQIHYHLVGTGKRRVFENLIGVGYTLAEVDKKGRVKR